jgi:hypothetical protein
MAAPDETAVDETGAAEAAPSIAERLERFINERLSEQPDAGEIAGLAEDILSDFFRVDVDASSIYAVPGVDVETLEGFAMVHWGPMAGRLDPDELRSIGGVFIEVAEASDLDSAMVRWLLRDPGSTREGAAKILASFRTFRAELDVAEPEPADGPAE